MHSKSIGYIVLGALFLVSTKSARLSKHWIEVDDAVQLIISVRSKLRFSCVHIVTSEFQEHHTATRLTKALSALDIQTALMDVGHLDYYHHRGCSNPMRVLLPDTLLAGAFLQVSRNVRLSEYKWLLFLLDFKKMESVFQDVYVPFDCELIVVTSQYPGLLLTEVYRVATYLPLRRNMFGWWTPKIGFKAFSTGSLYDRRNNLQGIQINAAVIQNSPVNIIEKTNGTILLKGYFGKLWDILQNRLNITVTYVEPSEGLWGNPTDHGWDGMVGMILRGEANLSACGIAMLRERTKVVDFSIPLYESQFRVFIRKAVDRDVVDANDYLNPFSKSLWIALLVVTFTAAALLVFQDRLMQNQVQHVADNEEERYRLSDAILLVFGVIFCQQGPVSPARRLSLRLMQVAMYMVGVVAISSYSGTLISSLAVYTPSLPFEDLEGLNKSKYSLGMGYNSLAHHSFRVANSGVLHDLHEKYLTTNTNLINNMELAFSRVCEKDFTFIALNEALSSDVVKCDVTYLPNSFMKGSLALTFPRGSPYRGIFNYVLLQMTQTGLMSYLYTITWRRIKISLKPPPLRSIDYTDIRPLLALMLAGLVLSIAVLVLERCKASWPPLRVTPTWPRRSRKVNVQPRRVWVPPDRRIVFE